MRALIATLIALMLFATTPVAAEDFEDGVVAYNVGNYRKALRPGVPSPNRKQVGICTGHSAGAVMLPVLINWRRLMESVQNKK